MGNASNQRSFSDALIEAAVDAIITIDVHGIVQSFNPAAERIFDYRASEVIGKSVNMLMPYPHRSSHDDYIDRYLETGKAKIIGLGREATGQRKDGSIFPIHLSVDEFQTSDGRMFVGILQDISGRKRVEEQLHEQKEAYETLFRESPDGISVMDVETQSIVYANPIFCHMFGYEEKEVRGMALTDFHPQDRVEEALSEFQAASTGEKPVVNNLPCVRKDGSHFLSEVTVAPRVQEGRLQLLSFFRDITQRVEAVEKLKEVEAYYEDLFEKAPDMYISVTPTTGTIRECNQTAMDKLGFTKDELIGRPIFNIYHPDSIEDAKKAFQTFTVTGEIHDVELRVMRSDGNTIDISLNATAVRDEKGKILFSRSTWRDITEQKRDRRQGITHFEVSKALAEADTLEEASTEFIRAVCKGMDWKLGIVWVVNHELGELHRAGEWHRSTELADFEKRTRKRVFKYREDLPGRVWAGGEPIWSMDVKSEPGSLWAQFDEKLGRGVFYYPFKSEGRVVGVLELHSEESRPHNEELADEINSLGNELGQLTARMQAVEELGRSEARYRHLFDSSPSGVAVSDARTEQFSYVNPTFARMFGYSEMETLSLGTIDIHPRESLDRIDAEFEAQARGEKTVSTNMPCLREDGSIFFADISTTSYTLAGQKYNVSFFFDITERERARQRLAAQYEASKALAEADTLETASNEFIRAVCEQLNWALGTVWIVDRRQNLLRCASCWHKSAELEYFVKRTCEITFDYDEGLPGRTWATGEPLWTDDYVRESGYLRARLAVKLGLHGAIFFPIKSEGAVVGVIELHSKKREEIDENLILVLDAIGNQLAQFMERKYAEQEADRVKSEFFALISHELRTPLTSIVGYLELIMRDGDGQAELTDDQRQFLSVIGQSTKRLQRLVGDLLFVAQIETGSFILEAGSVDLAAMSSECVTGAQPHAAKAGVDLEFEAEPVPMIEGDADRLGQMLDNLISNALKFTPADGKVTVRVSCEDPNVLIQVTDTGPGIAEADKERLFDRFFRAPFAVEKSVPGIGLGLSIVKAIVDGHQGHVSVDSKEGLGTTFSVELPLSAHIQSGQESGAATDQSQTHEPGRNR